MNNTLNLTEPNPELAALVKATHPGMAHWAGTGPAGKVCRDCVAWVLIDQTRLCAKYRKMMGGGKWEKKKVIPGSTAACRHFEPKPIPPDARGGKREVETREKGNP